jgi:hypothetical protein
MTSKSAALAQTKTCIHSKRFFVVIAAVISVVCGLKSLL